MNALSTLAPRERIFNGTILAHPIFLDIRWSDLSSSSPATLLLCASLHSSHGDCMAAYRQIVTFPRQFPPDVHFWPWTIYSTAHVTARHRANGDGCHSLSGSTHLSSARICCYAEPCSSPDNSARASFQGFGTREKLPWFACQKLPTQSVEPPPSVGGTWLSLVLIRQKVLIALRQDVFLVVAIVINHKVVILRERRRDAS